MPEYVYRARETTGTRYQPGGTNSELALTAVGSGVTVMNLRPRQEKEQYLVTLVTDDVDMGGTASDVTVRLGYQDVDGAQKETENIGIREYVNDFYGCWPASAEDFGYRYGLSVIRQSDGSVKGNSVSFLLPVKDVERFTSVSLGVAGDDEWQVKNVLIHTAESVEPRSVRWTPGLNVSGVRSDRVISREVAGRLVFDLAADGTGLSDEAPSPDVDDAPDGTALPGRSFRPVLIQQGDTVRLDVDSVGVYERQDVNWSELRFNMTYFDAMQDLGFLKVRNTYTVEVLVGSDLNNLSGDDDCGSRNQFYFQLLFADGNASSIVLANQQLESDGFHSGVTEAFTLSTSQDYGDVEAVRIIPEDTASDSDKYDKLMIEQITVKRNTNGELTPLWRVNDVGWVGIDYRDEGASNSISGVRGRTMEEVSHVFPVTESSYAVNVQFSISTGSYVERGGANNGAATPQFEGELEAWIYYRDTQGRVRRYHAADVVERMYAFNNRAASYSEAEANGAAAGGKAVSDPNYMFRAGHTDRFEVSLDGLERLLYVNFFARSAVNCTWNVNDVEAWLVRGQGRRILNVAGEYAMVYPEGKEPELIGRADSQMVPKYYRQLYMGVAAGKSTPTMTVNFADASSVKIDDTVLESRTILRRVPATGSDTLNVVLYPGRSTASLEGYDLTRLSVVPEGSAESVEPLILRFVTGSGAGNQGGGAGGAVSVSVGYKDAYGNSRVLYLDDVRAYLTGGEKSFGADSTREARILTGGMKELRWIELTPRDEPDSGTTIWNLKSVSAKLGDGGRELTRAVTESLLGGVTFRCYLANIQVGATVEYRTTVMDEETGEASARMNERELTGGSMDVLIASGEALRVTPRITGSDEGVNVSVYSRDVGSNSTGGADFRDTRGYTPAVLEQRAADAATPEEAALWRSVQPDVGSWTKQGDAYILTPPRNFTGGSMGYRITVTSLEDDTASVTVDVTVSSENDPVAQQIADLRAKQQLEAQREIRKKQEELQSQIDSMNSLGGGFTRTDGGVETAFRAGDAGESKATLYSAARGLKLTVALTSDGAGELTALSHEMAALDLPEDGAEGCADFLAAVGEVPLPEDMTPTAWSAVSRGQYMMGSVELTEGGAAYRYTVVPGADAAWLGEGFRDEDVTEIYLGDGGTVRVWTDGDGAAAWWDDGERAYLLECGFAEVDAALDAALRFRGGA